MSMASEPAVAGAAMKMKPAKERIVHRTTKTARMTVTTTSAAAAVDTDKPSNEPREPRRRPRKNKALKSQLPSSQDDDVAAVGQSSTQNRSNEAAGGAKKITILQRQAISVESMVRSDPSKSNGNQEASTSRKSTDDTTITVAIRAVTEANATVSGNPAGGEAKTTVQMVKEVKAVVSKKPANIPRHVAKFVRKTGVGESSKKPVGNGEVAKEREPINEEALPRLERDFIFPLRTKNPRFAAAVYFCRLCNCHINTLKYAETHMTTNSHIRAKEEFYLVEFLESLPWPPSETHCAALNPMILQTIMERGRSLEDGMRCFQLAEQLTQYFRTKLHPGCFVRLYGSSATGFALKTSNVNLELIYPPEFTHAWALMNAHKLLGTDEQFFTQVTPEFDAKWPYIKFFAAGFGFWLEHPAECILSVCNTQAFEISILLQTYRAYFPRLAHLAQLCRYWAHVCHFDDATLGGLPPYAFDLMMVHYLQQRQPPALPIFHEMEAFKGPGTFSDACLRFLTNDMRSLIDWSSLLIEDEWNFSELWLGFLKYYTLDFDMQTHVVNIRSSQPVTRAEKDWRTSRRLGIEDPFLPNKNVAQMTQHMFDYFLHCLRLTYKYFAMPQTIAGPLFEFDADYRLVVRNILPLLMQRRLDSGGDRSTDSSVTTTAIEKMLADLAVSAKSDIQESSQGNVTDDLPKAPQRRYDRQEILNLHGDTYEWNENWSREFDKDCERSATGLQFMKRAIQSGTASIEESDSSPNGYKTNGEGEEGASTLMYISSGRATPLPDISEGIEPTFIAAPIDFSQTSSAEDETPTSEVVPGCIVPQRPALISESSEISGIGEEEQCLRSGEFVANDTTDCIIEGDEDDNVEINDQTADAIAGGSIRESATSDPDVLLVSNGVDLSPVEDEVPEAKDMEPLDEEADKSVQAISTLEAIRQKRRQVALSPEIMAAINELKLCDYNFVFSEIVFTEGKLPVVLCAFCNVAGHNAKKCPEKQLPPLVVLPIVPQRYSFMLTSFLQDVWNTYAITSRRLQWQEIFRADLERRLRETLRPDARVQLFGSSCNGFGFVRSDLDLCLTFGDSMVLPPNENPLAIIKLVANVLRRDRDFRDVLPVTKAKVPIVRFYYLPSKLEGDISLYNCLALRNTMLLRAYSNIDPRVKALGYIVKVFAKFCDIGDASRGSLSSYAYVIMMLHYLQRTQPPVIPVLQELADHRTGRQPVIVDGWDTYFFADVRHLAYVWQYFGQNQQSLYDLWLGFLRYYTEVFDANAFVIQMRRSEPLTKFEKLWCDKPLAIEDPFDLNHNLASGLSWRMYIYIMKVFIQAREAFGHPRHEKIMERMLGNMLTYEGLEQYFFDFALRQKEPPPKDRVCKFCGHVGHFVDSCPLKKSNQKKTASGNKADNDDDGDAEDGAGPSKPVKSASK